MWPFSFKQIEFALWSIAMELHLQNEIELNRLENDVSFPLNKELVKKLRENYKEDTKKVSQMLRGS